MLLSKIYPVIIYVHFYVKDFYFLGHTDFKFPSFYYLHYFFNVILTLF